MKPEKMSEVRPFADELVAEFTTWAEWAEWAQAGAPPAPLQHRAAQDPPALEAYIRARVAEDLARLLTLQDKLAAAGYRRGARPYSVVHDETPLPPQAEPVWTCRRGQWAIHPRGQQ